MNPPPTKHAHKLKYINLATETQSGLTSSNQPSNPQANYKPHYVLSVRFPHHINSAMWSDREANENKDEAGSVYTTSFILTDYFLHYLFSWFNFEFVGIGQAASLASLCRKPPNGT